MTRYLEGEGRLKRCCDVLLKRDFILFEGNLGRWHRKWASSGTWGRNRNRDEIKYENYHGVFEII